MQRHDNLVLTGDQLAPLVVDRNQILFKTVRGLAITQVIIGLLTVTLGTIAAFLDIWYGNHYQGIWGGIWIVVAGLIGLSSARNPNSCCITGIYMSFTIVCTVISFFSGILFINGILSFPNSCMDDGDKQQDILTLLCDERVVAKGLGMMIPFLILMVVEFFVSIIASAYSCKGTDCCASCSQPVPGPLYSPRHHQYPITTSAQQVPNGTSMGINYPSVPYHHSSRYHQPPQYPGYTQQPVATMPYSRTINTPVLPKLPDGLAFRSNPGQLPSGETNPAYSHQPTATICGMDPPPYDSVR